jgi:hypothetical protein
MTATKKKRAAKPIAAWQPGRYTSTAQYRADRAAGKLGLSSEYIAEKPAPFFVPKSV